MLEYVPKDTTVHVETRMLQSPALVEHSMAHFMGNSFWTAMIAQRVTIAKNLVLLTSLTNVIRGISANGERKCEILRTPLITGVLVLLVLTVRVGHLHQLNVLLARSTIE